MMTATCNRSAVALALTGALALSAGLGCVTQSTYDEVVAERDATKSEMAALRNENANLTDRLAVAETAVAASQREMESLTGTYDQLVGELRQEVESGQIAIRRVAEGISLNVSEKLLFQSGDATLGDSGKALLQRVADRIQSEKSSVYVEGHTDNVPVGSALRERYPTNWELAGARSAIVVRTLTEAGVDPTRLRAVSRGPFAPIASNDTQEGRAKNRRTEIILRPPAP